jgi:leucyl-tRNA synthetase
MQPKKICYYSAASWKWKVYLMALEKSVSTKIALKDLMKEVMKDPDLRKMGKKVARFAQKIVEEINRMPKDRKQRQLQLGFVDENKTLEEAEPFFGGELNADICVYLEDDSQRYDPKGKAELARPYRPAIFIE